ncbi:autotransporter outer membrane beta-barrel domain-containing protein [Stratiformator vulcanicus]|uniref:Outer membrane protein B n=1 Tax=Stratiformator vulcanicus TaxID=2527980 RepID=A0A517QZE4_9PLAN|nr:autotransporter outer membrane beta-barrel domain-containing protein [Stratiformator vulcanicus]QDT36978.1 Outer membrane protein B precursor [Stratiformator vulcanicus]
MQWTYPTVRKASLATVLTVATIVPSVAHGQTDLRTVSRTVNQRSVANALETIRPTVSPGDDMFEVIDSFENPGITPAEQREGLQMLSGEAVAGVFAPRLALTRQFDRMLLEQIRPIGPERPGQIIGAPAVGGYSGGAIVRGQSACKDCGDVGCGNWGACGSRAYYRNPRPSTWARLFAYDSQVDSDPNDPIGFDSDAYGVLTGISIPFGDSLLLGGAFGYANGEFDPDNRLGGVDSDTYRGSLFGRFLGDDFYILGSVNYGYDTFASSRRLEYCDIFRFASATEFDAHNFDTSFELGTTLQPTCNVAVQPLIGFRYIRLWRDSFVENGASDASLAFGSAAVDAFDFRLGGRVTGRRELRRGLLFLPELRAWWMHDFLADQSTTTAAFTGAPGVPFIVRGAAGDDNFAVLGAGATFALYNTTAITLQYDTAMSDDAMVHAGNAGLLFTW